MKCFMCDRIPVGMRTLTHMGPFPLRHGPLEVPHCAVHAAPPVQSYKFERTSEWVKKPYEYPPEFLDSLLNFNISGPITITDEDIEQAKRSK